MTPAGSTFAGATSLMDGERLTLSSPSSATELNRGVWLSSSSSCTVCSFLLGLPFSISPSSSSGTSVPWRFTDGSFLGEPSEPDFCTLTLEPFLDRFVSLSSRWDDDFASSAFRLTS